MRNKIAVLIVKDDKVFIVKDNNQWAFPIFEGLNEEKLVGYTSDILISSFDDLVKDDGIHIQDKSNKKFISGEFCSLDVEIKDFNPSNYQEYKRISLENIDNKKWNEESKSLINELKEYLSKQSFFIKIDTDKYSKKDDGVKNSINSIVTKKINEAEGDLVWKDTCSLLEAERKFEEIIVKQYYKYYIEKQISKRKAIRLFDESGKEIRRES